MIGMSNYAGVLGCNTTLDLTDWLFETALDNWTERPQLSNHCDERDLRLYDAIIWNKVYHEQQQLKFLKKQLREARTEYQEDADESNLFGIKPSAIIKDLESDVSVLQNDIDQWKYVGAVFRCIDCKPKSINYHRLIASWTDDAHSFDKFNHLMEDHKYVFLIGHTNRDLGFDVNLYRKYISRRHVYTEYEREIILPMCEKYVKDVFYGTLSEFHDYLRRVDINDKK